MFHDKSDVRAPWSMTRVVAFLFCVGVLRALLLYAGKGTALNWPFAVVAAVTLLAVPLQSLFTFLGEWIASREGRSLLTTAVHKIEDMIGRAPPAPTPQTATASVSVGQ
jgi:hypothetical protein